MSFHIAYLPGDGIGPEVAGAAREVLDAVSRQYNFSLTYSEHSVGGNALDQFGVPCPDETLRACLDADAVLFGAVGGPQWEVGSVRPEAGLLRIREEMKLFANLRPVTLIPGLESLSPLRPEVSANTDLLIIRELIGGMYYGEHQEGDLFARDHCDYTREQILSVSRLAFETARKRRNKVTSVDKSNILATSRLWRKTITELHELEYADVELDHVLVDAMAMKLVQAPTEFDVVVTENLFGDILSDEASVFAGSIGLAPSASLGRESRGLYEPIHGSAPDIAGQGKANPIGSILSGALLLRYSLGQEDAAVAVEQAVRDTLRKGHRTSDLGGSSSCTELTAQIISCL